MCDKTIILELKNVSKMFENKMIFDDVSFSLEEGQILGVYGDNGAGKTTVLNIINRSVIQDEGQVVYKGEMLGAKTVKDVLDLGIATIHQDVCIPREISVQDYFFMGREILKNFIVLDRRRMEEILESIIIKYNLPFTPNSKMKELKTEDIQLLNVIIAAHRGAEIILMDDPTSFLSYGHINILYNIMNCLKSDGVAFVYISHSISELSKLAKNVAVIDGGKLNIISSKEIETRLEDFIVDENHSKSNRFIGEIIFEIKNFSKEGVFNNINISLRKGEIISICGKKSDGRNQFVQALCGCCIYDIGDVFLNDKNIKIKNIKSGMEMGVCIFSSSPENTYNVEEEKKMKIKQMFSMPKKNGVKLSFGNRQIEDIKDLFASPGYVYILDEPTRGLDISGIRFFLDIAEAKAMEGSGVIIVTSEIENVSQICNTIYVFREGNIHEQS